MSFLKQLLFLVEYPVALLGGFERDFLKLPKEVLITSMREHQKYFSAVDNDGKLLPHFIAVSNTRANDMDVVKKGMKEFSGQGFPTLPFSIMRTRRYL